MYPPVVYRQCTRKGPDVKKWMVMAKRADFGAISEACGISQVTARLIRNREVCGVEETRRFLNGTLKDLYDPALLPDAARAVSLLEESVSSGARIRVIGDYDVDGICAAYIFYTALTACGALVDVVLPERMRDGYGMNVRMVREAAEDGIGVLLTCDNGIAAIEPVKEAKTLGLKVIVTDHHEVPFTEREDGTREYHTPEADAVVDPKLIRPGDEHPGYPFPEICGAVVAYKISQLLLERMACREKLSLMKQLLAFCALATVCDVMPLKEENRIIVREGLLEAQQTENTGLRALLQVTGLWDKPLNCFHAGFVIGPCLNASGRLDRAQRALELFMIRDADEALVRAQELKDLNERRKSMTIQQTAIARAEAETKERRDDRVLVLYLPECHESLAGIIAGRIKELYYRPAFVLTDAGESMLKGSGRSIDSYDMYSAMNRCADLLVKFGGHRMAGGLSLCKEHLPELRRRLNEECSLTPEDLQEVLHIDMELPPGLFRIPLVEEFRLLEPCGTANPRPLFVTRGVSITSARVLGAGRNVIRLYGRDMTGASLEMIRFEEEDLFAGQAAGGKSSLLWRDLLNGNGTLQLDMVYYPEINSWNGRETLQFIISDYRVRS